MVTKRKKPNDKQNVELFKFFENTKQQKTSPISKNEPKPLILTLGQRRSTRLKTEIFIENFPETLPDGEYDISKEDFENADIQPLKKKIKLSEVDDSTSAKRSNEKNKKKSGKDESIVENKVKPCDLDKTKKCQSSNTDINTNDNQKMTENLIESIDTNAIAEMLQDTSLDSDDSKKRRRKHNENSKQIFDNKETEDEQNISNNLSKKTSRSNESDSNNTLLENSQPFEHIAPNDSGLQKDDVSTKKKSKSKKKTNKSIQNNTDIENSESLLDITQSDSELQTDNDFTNTKTKKKHHKSIQNNNSESLIDITQSDTELNADCDHKKKKSKSKNKKRISTQISSEDLKSSDLQSENENSAKLVDINQSDSELQSGSDLTENKTKSPKKKNKSLPNKSNENSVDKFKKPKKKHSKTNNNVLENNLYENNPELSLTISDEDNMENKPKNNADKSQENCLENENNQQSNYLEKSTQSLSQLEENSPNVNNEYKNINENSIISNIDENSIISKSQETSTANNLEKSSKNAVQPKKRGRKPKAEKNNLLKYFTVQEKQHNESNELQNESTNTNLNNITLNKDTSQISANDNSAEISDKVITRSRKSNTPRKQDKSVNSEITPRKRGRPKLEPKIEPRVVKVNVAKEINKRSGFPKLSKVTKEQIKQGKHRYIPKGRLEEILEIIDDSDHPIWEDRNISCNPGIQTFWEIRNTRQSELNMKLKYARQFLLRRDWTNLMKILCLYNEKAKDYYPLLAKYAALLLAHTDNDQFDKFIQFLTNMTDSSAVIKKCTKITNTNEE